MKFKYIGEIFEDMLSKYLNEKGKYKKDLQENEENLPHILQSKFKMMAKVLVEAGDLQQKDWGRILYPTADAFHHLADVFGPANKKKLNTENLRKKMEAAIDLFGQFLDMHGEEFEQTEK